MGIGAQDGGKFFQLRALAAAVQAFDGDEDASARGHREIIQRD
jgi:hypothetical protein